MLSLKDRLGLLERDLVATPPGFVMNADLPFAIFRYDPNFPEEGEWRMRREIGNLAVRVENATQRHVRLVSLAQLFWKGVEESEGIDALADLERQQGFEKAQEQVGTYLSDADFRPLPDLLAAELAGLDPQKDFAFLTRAAVFAPAAYRISSLLEQMKGKTRIPTVLFYPGTWQESLNFMGLRQVESPLGSYRVKIYGRES